MEIITKKTTELTEIEQSQIVSLFEEVFQRKNTIGNMLNYYTSNYLGYSFHTLIKQDDKIVGSNSMVPIIYYLDGQKIPCVNSGGTMISKSCRGIENFYDMIKESYRYSEDFGFKAVIGFPNDNSYPLFKGIRMMKDIGKLHIYVLPFKIGGIKKKLRILNPISLLFSQIWLVLSSYLASSNSAAFKNQKDLESFEAFRYKRSIPNIYEEIDLGGGIVHYAVTEYESVRTAFIVDITNKSEEMFCRASRQIWKRDKNRIDLILYVGNLPFKYHGLIEVPRKYEPKAFNFTGHIFDESIIDKNVFFDLNNWDVNLSNFDLI